MEKLTFYDRALRADRDLLEKVLATGESGSSHTFYHSGLTEGVPKEKRVMQIDHVVEIQLFCLWLDWAKLEGDDISAGFLYELYHVSRSMSSTSYLLSCGLSGHTGQSWWHSLHHYSGNMLTSS